MAVSHQELQSHPFMESANTETFCAAMPWNNGTNVPSGSNDCRQDGHAHARAADANGHDAGVGARERARGEADVRANRGGGDGGAEGGGRLNRAGNVHAGGT